MFFSFCFHCLSTYVSFSLSLFVFLSSEGRREGDFPLSFLFTMAPLFGLVAHYRFSFILVLTCTITLEFYVVSFSLDQPLWSLFFFSDYFICVVLYVFFVVFLQYIFDCLTALVYLFSDDTHSKLSNGIYLYTIYRIFVCIHLFLCVSHSLSLSVFLFRSECVSVWKCFFGFVTHSLFYSGRVWVQSTVWTCIHRENNHEANDKWIWK